MPEATAAAAPGERREGRISLAALRCFVAVVEGGGLSRAAEHLGLSQPTISVTLAGLERACGTLLLHRRPRDRRRRPPPGCARRRKDWNGCGCYP